jgi:quercetin dioxygenase-like cupin family protein
MVTATANQVPAATERTETIAHNGVTLCIIVRANPEPTATTFYTPNDFNLQCGNIVYPAGSEIPRHTHRAVSRTIRNTSEVLVVQKGLLSVDLYSQEREFVCSRDMATGDVIVLMAGGHGFRLLEDTILLEVKQGPYGGLQEKDRF